MIRRDPALVRNLMQILDSECKLHERYLQLLQREQESVVAADLKKIARISAEREKLNTAIQTAQDKRLAFLSRYPQGNEIKLSEWVESHLHPADRAALAPSIIRLKGLVQQGKTRSSDLAQLVSFSLGLVGGCLSIIWSATQGVFRSYAPNGVVKESSHPVKSRQQGTLKQA